MVKILKVLLVHRYGEIISFSRAHSSNQSSLVFLSEISKEDIAETVRNFNSIKESAEMVRKFLLQEDDVLKDKFYVANDLLDAWNSMKIPENVLECLCVLLNEFL